MVTGLILPLFHSRQSAAAQVGTRIFKRRKATEDGPEPSQLLWQQGSTTFVDVVESIEVIS